MARAAPFVAPLSLPVEVRLMQATADVLFAMVALAACAVALWWAARLPVLAIQGLQVEGQVTRNSESTLRANTLHRLSGNFLTIDLQDCRTAFESVPWVRRAMVRRIWPLRLSVQLEEHQPVALWTGADGNDRLVNSFGEVFEANVGDVEDDELPSLSGPEGSAAQMLAMQRRLSVLLAPLNAGDLILLTLSARGSWRADLDKGATIELGRGSDDEVIARTERFVRTMPRVGARFQHALASADLRHADGFALRLKGVTYAPAAKPATR